MRTALIPAASLVALSFPLLASNASADTCAPISITVGVEGTGSVGKANTITSAHAGPGARYVNYPGSIWPLGPYNYDQSVRMGVDETKRVVREEHARCPGSTIHIDGHSQGARVAGDAIEELAAEDGDVSYIQADLLADPRHPGHGVEVVVPLGIPGYRMMGERESFGNANVNQVCVTSDPICDMPNLVENPLAVVDVVPNYFARHGAYPVGVVNEVPVEPGPAAVVSLPVLPVLPPLPNVSEPYVERPLSVYIPDVLERFVPVEVSGFIPPPVVIPIP